jgi:hypothetical protein
MKNTQPLSSQVNIAVKTSSDQTLQVALEKNKTATIFKKLRGGSFLVIGFFLSPLSWWNDLFFNLPIAYGFGYLCSLFSENLLVPCAIAAYWLSNIAGILLMQVGVLDVVRDRPQALNLKKELITGLVSSTIYTLIILALIHFKILDTPVLFPKS